jgi:hypothetical protein
VRRAAGHLLMRGTIGQNEVPPFGNLGCVTRTGGVDRPRQDPPERNFLSGSRHFDRLLCVSLSHGADRAAQSMESIQTIAGIDLGRRDRRSARWLRPT